MATSTLLPTARPLATDNRDDNRTLGSQPNYQIDHQIHAPQAQLQYPAPQRMSQAGPDEVDRKADEFIAKFREQIRLQRSRPCMT